MTSTPAAPSLRNVSGKHSGAWCTLENKPWQSRGCWSKGNIVCKEFIGELFVNLLFYSKDLITAYQGWKRPERSFSSFGRWRNWQKTVAWSGWIVTRELMPPKASAGLFPHPTPVFSIPVLSCHSHPGQGWEALCMESCFKWNDFIATGAS